MPTSSTHSQDSSSESQSEQSEHSKGNGVLERKVQNLIAMIITLIWSLSFFADVFIREYEPPAYIHAIMMTVAGALFAEATIRKVKE